jgi:peptide chain release factor 2
MGQPSFWDNQEKAQQTIQALGRSTASSNPTRNSATPLAPQALVELCDEDPSLEGDLQAELGKVERQFEKFELQAMLSGPHDASNAFLRIQAGTGGTRRATAQMLRACTRAGRGPRLLGRADRRVENEEAGIRSATLHVTGDYAYGNLQSETGVHRLVRISPFDSNARRQTSFAAVDVLPELDDSIEIEIRPDDLERQTFRSGGPGGQHQNKTESGVRYIHKPTGIAAESRTERSQHKNDAMAMQQLKAKLYRIEEQKRLAEVEKKYDEKGEVAWGSQIRNYVMQPYTLVKDVRTGVETAQIHAVLDGDLDEFIQAYLRLKTEKAHKQK